MFTNELKKDTRVLLRGSGWQATIKDNAKGTIRLAEVQGFFTEIGSIYAHDIIARWENGRWVRDIEYTPAQVKCAAMNGVKISATIAPKKHVYKFSPVDESQNAFNAKCIKCGESIPVGDKVADLNGESFNSYYHTQCANTLSKK